MARPTIHRPVSPVAPNTITFTRTALSPNADVTVHEDAAILEWNGSERGRATRTRGPGARFELASRDPQPPSITRLAHPGRRPPNRGEEYSILLDRPYGPELFHTPLRSLLNSGPTLLSSSEALSNSNKIHSVHRFRRQAEQRL